MNPHLSQFIQELPKDSLTMIRGNSLVLRNGDVHYPFRQDSDFLYLTGLSVPGLTLTIQKWEEKSSALSGTSFTKEVIETILWREPIIEKDIIWGSDKLSDDEMMKISGIDDVRDIAELESYCSNHDANKHESFMSTTEISFSEKLSKISHRSSQKQTNSIEMTDTSPWQSILTRMRTIKTPDEIGKIQNCIRITESIYEEVLKQMKPGMYEYEIEAMIAYGFRKHHGTEAFPTIVASGANSCILHYDPTKNSRQIQSGDIVLIDFGIELDGYGADISRTFAVGGFSQRQREIYDSVQDVKNFAEKTLKTGITRKAWNLGVKEYMYEACKKLKLPNIQDYTQASNPYYPHSIGHFLGLDTHDVGSSDVPLESGMILTIEPGIYIRAESIGIRIEDDYLVTDSGCVKL